MRPREFARILLHKAEQDEAVLETLLPEARFDDETVGFHAQQAVEKLLKAWLSHLGIDYPRVHRLETLVDLLAVHGHVLPTELADVGKLTPFGTVLRYEDMPLTGSFDRVGALRLVRAIRAHVEGQMAREIPNAQPPAGDNGPGQGPER